MSNFWFEIGGSPCYCKFCSSLFKEQIIRPYEERGLNFNHGELVTLVKVKQMIKLILTRVDEIHQPTSLKALCVGIIWRQVKCHTSYCLLPIPDTFRSYASLYEQLGHLQSSGSKAKDSVFSEIQCRELPGIMWDHIDHNIVRNREHPSFPFPL